MAEKAKRKPNKYIIEVRTTVCYIDEHLVDAYSILEAKRKAMKAARATGLDSMPGTAALDYAEVEVEDGWKEDDE